MFKVIITTASPLAKEKADLLKKAVAKKHGAAARCEFRVDPSVIGGIKAVIGAKAIDMTVAGQLVSIKKQLLAKV